MGPIGVAADHPWSLGVLIAGRHDAEHSDQLAGILRGIFPAGLLLVCDVVRDGGLNCVERGRRSASSDPGDDIACGADGDLQHDHRQPDEWLFDSAVDGAVLRTYSDDDAHCGSEPAFLADSFVDGDHGSDNTRMRLDLSAYLSGRHPDVRQAPKHRGAGKMVAV